MKRFFALVTAILTAASLAGCKAAPSAQSPSEPSSLSALPSDSTQSLTLTLVDGAETGNLVLAGESAGEVYTLTAADIPVFLDGEPADASALLDGQTVEVCFDSIQETYPGKFSQVQQLRVWSLGSNEQPCGSLFDLCGLYLQVLEDLWATDEGLNQNVSLISVDLTQAPGELTQAQQQAIAYIFASRHNAKPLTLSYKELGEQGYLGEPEILEQNEPFYAEGFQNGLLFSIEAAEEGEGKFFSRPVIQFRAQKYRGPLGADFFDDCSAVWPQCGSWQGGKDPGYKVGSHGIS